LAKKSASKLLTPTEGAKKIGKPKIKGGDGVEGGTPSRWGGSNANCWRGTVGGRKRIKKGDTGGGHVNSLERRLIEKGKKALEKPPTSETKVIGGIKRSTVVTERELLGKKAKKIGKGKKVLEKRGGKSGDASWLKMTGRGADWT